MRTIKPKGWLLALVIISLAGVGSAQSSKQGKRATEKQESSRPKEQGTTAAISGSGTYGHLALWGPLWTLGNSSITEDKFGNVTLKGLLKFPDGTVQGTGGLSSVTTDSSLMGAGTPASPLGLRMVTTDPSLMGAGTASSPLGLRMITTDPSLAGAGTPISPLTLNAVTTDSTLKGAGTTASPLGLASPALGSVTTDSTLTGDGTAALPLGVNVPLTLSGNIAQPVLTVQNSTSGAAIFGQGGNPGVKAKGANFKPGVVTEGGESTDGNPPGAGIIATVGPSLPTSIEGLAGEFMGNVLVFGNFEDVGVKDFKIDDPLDPTNKYLLHAAIESSEVLNVYSGNVVTDANGVAVVHFPDWFQAINRDFRYQLTVIGTFAQAIVSRKIENNQFTIMTSQPNVEVSWQVTGVRSDPGMLAHPFQAVQDKPNLERGTYLDPKSYGQPEEKGVQWALNPRLMQHLKQEREQVAQKAQSGIR